MVIAFPTPFLVIFLPVLNTASEVSLLVATFNAVFLAVFLIALVAPNLSPIDPPPDKTLNPRPNNLNAAPRPA